MINCLQINLGRGHAAQNLLMQISVEKQVDILFVCEHYKKANSGKYSEDSTKKAAEVTKPYYV